MEFLKYGHGIDMAMEKFDACISIIDKLRHVTIRKSAAFLLCCLTKLKSTKRPLG